MNAIMGMTRIASENIGTGAGDGLPWKNRAGVRASFEID